MTYNMTLEIPNVYGCSAHTLESYDAVYFVVGPSEP
jgi:hypothetical protein